jgi:UDP-N-acetylmuramate dehydrogenase
MNVSTAVSLAAWTTLRVGGPATEFVEVYTDADAVAAVSDADAAGIPVLVLGGGSNVLIGDAGFDGRVVAMATKGITEEADMCSGAMVTVAAGENWDALVALTVRNGWTGVEALSGIPGLVGGTPIQNVGAYGQDVSATIARVRTYDRAEKRIRTFFAADCRFAYRTSRFKAEPGRYLILDVTFQFGLGDLGAPVAYLELARRLGVELGERAPLADVRRAVLEIRAGKGMVLDESDHDTWSAGSFFTNPILDAAAGERLPAAAPRWPVGDDRVKTSAAWLIEHAGFHRGHGDGPATLSTKHTLALTNRGTATAADVLALAREVRDGVRDRFGIELVPEPVLVGSEL